MNTRMTITATLLASILGGGVFLAMASAATPVSEVPAFQSRVAVSPLKGLAEAWPLYGPQDRAALGAVWYYHWGEGCPADNQCVNMVRNWQLPQSCYTQTGQTGYLLVGNEPENAEPAGHLMSPHDAVTSTLAIQAMCPTTRLVVGNSTQVTWLNAFVADYLSTTGHPFSQRLGFHCYGADDQDTTDDWHACMNIISNFTFSVPLWLTEFNCLGCPSTTMYSMLVFMDGKFERIAPFTNRQPPEAYTEGWALPGADLVNSNGTLSPKGAVYAAYPTNILFTKFFPFVQTDDSGFYIIPTPTPNPYP